MRPAVQGAALALVAAFLFGASTPLIQQHGAGVDPITTAGLLYAGAVAVGAVTRRRRDCEPPIALRDLPRLVAMALFGALLAPVALVWGLQHTSATSASLMLTLEAVFTALLARAFYGESMDRRVWTAMALLSAGGMALVLDNAQRGSTLP